jgi:uncharacterized protein (TIGR03067 family)
MRQLAFLGVLAAAALTLAAGGPKSDKDLIQGDWEIVSFERNGKQVQDAVGDVYRFAGGKVLIMEKDDPCETCEFVVALFPDQNPKEIDFKYTGTELEDIAAGEDTMKGIYQLDADKFVLCIAGGGDDRPTEFKTEEGQEPDLLVLKRVK